MNESEITALAREYADEATQTDASDPNLSVSDLNGIKHDVAEYAEEIIRFLLRRYALVKKGRVKAKYKEVLAALESNDNEDVKWGTYRLSLLDSLFPEIAKEV